MAAHMTATEAKVLASPSTRRLVHEVLALAETRDIVDAMRDLEIVRDILRARLNG